MIPILLLTMVALTKASALADLNPLSDAAIDLINSLQDSWTAGRNFPEETPLEILEKLNGVVHNGSQNSLPVIKYNANRQKLRMKIPLPVNFDPRAKWPFCPSLNEIRDQGACGSCWALAAVEVMTDRYCIKSKGEKQFHFSAEDLLACSGDDGCDGGQPADAWSYFVSKGIVSGGNFQSYQGCRPYRVPPSCQVPGIPKYCIEETVPTPACIKRCQKGYNMEYTEDKKYGESAYQLLRNDENIMWELFLNGPVQASFGVFTDFESYKKGVYFNTWGEFMGFHSVKILGYGLENGTKYWLAANSWGEDWGDRGFFKIRRGVNECGIEDLIISGQPVV